MRQEYYNIKTLESLKEFCEENLDMITTFSIDDAPVDS